MKTNIPNTLFILTWLALPLVSAQAERIEHSADISPNGLVEISNVAGDVEVIGWNKSTVSLTGRTEEGVKEVRFDTNKRGVRIRVVHDKRGPKHDIEANLVLRMPATAEVEVTTVSADIEVEGMLAEQRLRSVSGDVDSDIADADIDVESISGEVSVRGTNASVRLNVSAVSGDIDLRDVSGELTVRSVSGDVNVEAGTFSRALMDNTSGDLRISGRPTDGASVELQTVSGDVLLSLCGKRSGNFDLETFSGDIIDLSGDQRVHRDRYGPGSELRFSEGDSGTRVEIDTMSGNIELDEC